MTTIIRSRHIFDGTGSDPFQGYLEYSGPFITRIGRGWDYGPIETGTRVIRHDEHFIMPGLHDNHVFFSGWMAANAGLDLSGAADAHQAASLIAQRLDRHPGRPVYAHGWNRAQWQSDPGRDALDVLSSDTPIVAIDASRSRYWLNTCASARYGFDEAGLAAETRANLIHEMCSDADLVRQSWRRFQSLMLSRGVVSCKDIVFDDCDVHRFLDDTLLDVTMYVEAVRRPVDVNALARYQHETFGRRTRFGGVKIMVDGVVADSTGDISGAYTNGARPPHVDYDAIEADVARLSDLGVSCCLTAEGDRAIDRCAEILARHTNPRVRHSISDLEMVTDRAARLMAESGVVAEIYPQILGLNASMDDAYMPTSIAGHDGSRFFHYSHLVDHGVTVTSGTDCPLFVADVPDSLLRASRRVFDRGEVTWFPRYAMPQKDLLRSWVRGGGDLPASAAARSGTISALPGSGRGRVLRRGAAASLTVFDRDLMGVGNDELRRARVLQTYVDGDLVFESEPPHHHPSL